MKAIKQILVGICLLASTAGFTQTWQIGYPNAGDVTATLNAGTLSISGQGNMVDSLDYSSYSPDIYPWNSVSQDIKKVIIEHGVTNIGYDAFRYCNRITTLIIPESVTGNEHGHCGGINCSSLDTVTVFWETSPPVLSFYTTPYTSCSAVISIPAGTMEAYKTKYYYFSDRYNFVERRSEEEFLIKNGVLVQYNGKGGNVVIPDGVTRIAGYVFENCSTITSVAMPETLTSIGNSAFSGCSYLTSVSMPESLTSIGERAFWICTGLNSITIPENITSIGKEAFTSCSGLKTVNYNAINYANDPQFPGSLTTVNIGNRVNTIPQSAFVGNSKLTTISIPGSVTTIGAEAFMNCGLTNISIPEGVTTIGNDAFRDCNKLTSVSISASVTTIGKSAFWGSGLTSVNIPENVASIGNMAFGGYSGFISFQVAEENPTFSSNNGILFNKDKTALLCYPQGKQEEHYTIPNHITSIGNYAFYNCINLTSVTISENVANIGSWAFCTQERQKTLTTVINLSIEPQNITYINPPNITYSVFDSIVTLYVPAGSKEAYENFYVYGYNPAWSDADEVIELPDTSVEISETPALNSISIEWQQYEHATGYRLIIYSDELHTDTLHIFEFDAAGEFTGEIPLRTGTTNPGHTVNGLSSDTQYYYALETLGINNIVLTKQPGDFTTLGGSTGIEDTSTASGKAKIIAHYSITGARLEKEPTNGLYIVLYDNGTAEKRVK
ncbi:MAG: leucine-rich repeat domain-containing protein [Prevotellaceae bacterium]|jgi:hypothetical protein|nr:leucine-rich repeat domain-containing protein [Prevotellaceae bacterium]